MRTSYNLSVSDRLRVGQAGPRQRIRRLAIRHRHLRSAQPHRLTYHHGHLPARYADAVARPAWPTPTAPARSGSARARADTRTRPDTVHRSPHCPR
jgi:hypothetical protein